MTTMRVPRRQRLQIAVRQYQHALYNAATGLVLQHMQKKEVQRKASKKRLWMSRWISRRQETRVYNTLIKELEDESDKEFQSFARVPPDLYHEIVRRVGPRIQKQHTFFRKALSPGLKVAITLTFLGTGISYHSLAHEFRCPHNTISLVISETCEAIIAEYMEESIKCPKTPEEWKGVARCFSERWNLHNVCGALDGKHVAVKCPPGSGSIYYNYKKFYPVVLMALVDSQYRFLFVDVGAQGSTSDGGVFRGSLPFAAIAASFFWVSL